MYHFSSSSVSERKKSGAVADQTVFYHLSNTMRSKSGCTCEKVFSLSCHGLEFSLQLRVSGIAHCRLWLLIDISDLAKDNFQNRSFTMLNH